jgi:hypothetical protein
MAERRDHDGLTGAEWEVLWQLFLNGPTEDGDLPSKSGRDSLIQGGWAFGLDGWQSLTEKGIIEAIKRGMDRKKEKVQRERRNRT